MAKEKKNSTLVTGFRLNGRILTGKEMYNELFREIQGKFNPNNLDHKIITPEPIEINFQEFKDALRKLPDTKAQGIDGLPANALRRLGYTYAYKEFSQWTSLRMSKQVNDLMSTARVVFLSKTSQEVVDSHKSYRCISI